MKNDKIALMIARYIINGCDFGAVNRKPKTIILKKLEEVMFYFVKNRILPRYLDFNEITEKSQVRFFREKVNFRWDGELVFSMIMTSSRNSSVVYYNSYYATVFRDVKEEELGLKLKPFIDKTGGIFNEKLKDFWEANKDGYQAVGISKELIEATISRLSPEKATHKTREASEKLNSMTSAAENTASAFRDFGRIAAKPVKGKAFIMPISGVDVQRKGPDEPFYHIGDIRGLSYPEFLEHQKTQLRETVALSNDQLNYGEEKAATFTMETNQARLEVGVDPCLSSENYCWHGDYSVPVFADASIDFFADVVFRSMRMQIWKQLNPGRRIPGSNRTKRLRKKMAKALANPLNKVKITKDHSWEAVDSITKIKAAKAAFDEMQQAKRRAAKAKRKAAFYCKNQRVNSILAHYALYKDRKK